MKPTLTRYVPKSRRWHAVAAVVVAAGAVLHPGGRDASAAAPAVTGEVALAGEVVNALGVELLAKAAAPGANALLSPYSIQSALAMTYAGADGETRTEMAGVLHYGEDEAALHQAFGALNHALIDAASRTTQWLARGKRVGAETGDPLTLSVANRLFGQEGYEFRAPFLALVEGAYAAPFEALDFRKNPDGARLRINGWVEEKTREKIRELIPGGGIVKETSLVLVNAIHMKAPWAEAFQESATKPEPFRVRGGAAVDVPAMTRKDQFGYLRRDGYTVVVVSYLGRELQFVVLLPDEPDGLPRLESRLSKGMLAECSRAPWVDVILHLPKFRMEPPVLRLGDALRGLGMKTAFDEPRGSANFDRMAVRRPDDYLLVSEVFHKTFIALDERGTEAAAATAVAMVRATSIVVDPPKPVEVRVDRPFLFAIQHRASGACLFLGRVVDPR